MISHQLGFPINGGTPKWLIYNGKTIYKWMMTGGTPFIIISENHQMISCNGFLIDHDPRTKSTNRKLVKLFQDQTRTPWGSCTLGVVGCWPLLWHPSWSLAWPSGYRYCYHGIGKAQKLGIVGIHPL